MSLELRVGQIDNPADNGILQRFCNTVDSATDSATDNGVANAVADAVDNAMDTLFTPNSSYSYSILVLYRI
jgi:hypothetical protein